MGTHLTGYSGNGPKRQTYRIFAAPPPLTVVCCVVVGWVTVVSRAVVVAVVDSDAHEAKLSIAAIPSRKIDIFISEFSLLRVRRNCGKQMYLSGTS